jgi:hypothetical protein
VAPVAAVAPLLLIDPVILQCVVPLQCCGPCAAVALLLCDLGCDASVFCAAAVPWVVCCCGSTALA